MSYEWDKCQQEVIEAEGGYHLVLAPPGCGKTQILTERIRHAHDSGIAYADMLCLTFTNRAARGMQQRIHDNISDSNIGDVYVGNIHRFCSRLLFTEGIVPSGTSVIDEDDSISILASLMREDEHEAARNYERRRVYYDIMYLSHFMFQIIHGHDKTLRAHPECIDSGDIASMRHICDVQHRRFTPEMMADIYLNYDFYLDSLTPEAYDAGMMKAARQMLGKMSMAREYERYKERNLLIDFEDLLLLTYQRFLDEENTDNHFEPHRRYRWIQVDEVQDLNPLQLSLIDKLWGDNDKHSDKGHTLMYLGDEQQAIFSFMGAKMSALQTLKQRCNGQLHHLYVNHRSPKYLLNVFNTFAEKVLHIDPDLLPEPQNNTPASGNELGLLHSSVLETEYGDVARFVKTMQEKHPDDTTAVLVLSNKDADAVSRELLARDVSHFKVSGEDVFSSPVVKLLFAHLTLMADEHNFIAWTRLLTGLHVFNTNEGARNFVRTLMNHAMLPSDFLNEGGTYVERFAGIWENEELVIFDTETTGLDVYEDDIVQIAAVKIRRGEVVKGSELSLYIETDRHIPEMLGDVVNPIIEERKHHRLLSHEEALKTFIAYIGDDALLGHNVTYDINILRNNLQRYLGGYAPAKAFIADRQRPVLDSLKLIRMLRPELKQYKLKYLLQILNLSGENSHLADADVDATRSVVNYCHDRAVEVLPGQRKLAAQTRVSSRAELLRRAYAGYWHSAYDEYDYDDSYHNYPALVREMLHLYLGKLNDGTIIEVPTMTYITEYLSHDLIDQSGEPHLSQQLSNHVMELNTLKEADICSSSTIKEKVFVTTIHKAKGLEFDNVIIFDAVEGRFPNFYSQNIPDLMAEDARKFYVAMTRAKKRLYVSQSMSRMNYRKEIQPRELTHFMAPLLKFFT